MPQPPRLIATSTGDHSAHHLAMLAAMRNAVLPRKYCPTYFDDAVQPSYVLGTSDAAA